MKDILQKLITSLVDNPSDVIITETEDEGIITLTIQVHTADMGRIIGKNGKVIRSLRNVMKIPAIKQNKRIDVNLSEA